MASERAQETLPSYSGLWAQVKRPQVYMQGCLDLLRKMPTVWRPRSPLQNALNLQILWQPTSHQGPHVWLPILHGRQGKTVFTHYQKMCEL